jgi:hypothetical protein
MAVAGVVLLYEGRHLTFFYDEWNFILLRRGGSLSTYLDPHNGHLSLFPVAIYKLLFKLVGLRHYWPYRAVLVALDLASSALLYALAARRIGRWLAIAPALLLALIGSANQDLLWPFQIGFLGSVAGGLGALLVIEARAATRTSDALATALVIYSVGSSSVGLTFMVAIAVALLVRGEWRRGLVIIGIPVVLYAIWFAGWETSQATSSLLGIPHYIVKAAAAGFGGVAGARVDLGPELAVAGALAIAALAWWRERKVTPLLMAAAAGALVFWGLAAIVRGANPDPQANRYVYISASFILLAAIDSIGPRRIGAPVAALLCALVATAVVLNVRQLHDAERGLTGIDDSVRASLSASEIAAPVISPRFVMSPVQAPQITAGPYLAAIKALGSPAPSVRQLERSRGSMRSTADSVLVLAERISSVAAPRGAMPCAPAPLRTTRSLSVRAGKSLLIETTSGPAKVYVRRFASVLSAPIPPLSARHAALIHFPADRAPTVPWTVVIAASSRPRACVA